MDGQAHVRRASKTGCLGICLGRPSRHWKAVINDKPNTLAILDYYKSFDSSDRKWTTAFLRKLNFPKDFVDMQEILYQNITRYIKIGDSYSEPMDTYNGYGQGDPGSLIPALAYVSIQFYYIYNIHPNIRCSVVIDDRNIRGDREEVLQVCEENSI